MRAIIKKAVWTFFLLLSLCAVHAQVKQSRLNFGGLYYFIYRNQLINKSGVVNGLSISKNDSSISIDEIFLYKDNTAVIIGLPMPAMDSLTRNYLNRVNIAYIKSSSEEFLSYGIDWGIFNLKGDSLIITFFAPPQVFLGRRFKIICYFKIINSDNFILLNEYSKLYELQDSIKNGEITYSPPWNYRFFPISIRPDSSLAWFKKKRWYKRLFRRASPP